MPANRKLRRGLNPARIGGAQYETRPIRRILSANSCPAGGLGCCHAQKISSQNSVGDGTVYNTQKKLAMESAAPWGCTMTNLAIGSKTDKNNRSGLRTGTDKNK